MWQVARLVVVFECLELACTGVWNRQRTDVGKDIPNGSLDTDLANSDSQGLPGHVVSLERLDIIYKNYQRSLEVTHFYVTEFKGLGPLLRQSLKDFMDFRVTAFKETQSEVHVVCPGARSSIEQHL